MRLIGRRSVASVLRWALGFVNVFVTLGVVATAAGLFASLFLGDFAAGFIDGLRDADPNDPSRRQDIFDRLIFLGGFVASLSTWRVINRLRRMFLAVNQGDAFEPANVGRLRGIGVGLIGVQFAGIVLDFTKPLGDVADRHDGLDLGAWLGIVIVFMLAEVFRQGSAMRDDQQMTV